MDTPSFLDLSGKEQRRQAKRQRRALRAVGRATTGLSAKEQRRIERCLRPLGKLLRRHGLAIERRQKVAFCLLAHELVTWGHVPAAGLPAVLLTFRRALERGGGNAIAMDALDRVIHQLHRRQEVGSRK